MSKSKKQKFETLSAIHLLAGTVAKGTLIDLEVDEQGNPVSPIYAGRVRRLNVATPADGSDGQGQALLDAATEEAGKIKAAAEQEAQRIKDAATEEAGKIKAAAEQEAQRIKDAATTPPPPAKK